MELLDEDRWDAVARAAKARCPRLTAADLADCFRRLDLLVGKIQNRHWVSKQEARNLVRVLVKETAAPA